MSLGYIKYIKGESAISVDLGHIRMNVPGTICDISLKRRRTLPDMAGTGISEKRIDGNRER